MTPPAGSFIWYELMTTDPDAAAKFYGAVIGWRIADRADPQAGGMDYRMIGRSDGGFLGGVFRLTPDMLQHGAQPAWMGYLQVPDVDAATVSIQGDGGRVLMPKKALPVGNIAMVADPMGTPFYIMSPIPPPDRPDARSDVFDPRAAQRVRWNELTSPDLARAKSFYARHFGFQFNETMAMGEMGDYCFIDHGGQRLGAIMQKAPGTPPVATWLFYFGVPSVMACKGAIERNGGKLLHGPMEVPGGDWILIASDPQGAVFGVVGEKGET